jgi:Tfp pilus assembly protein PilF
MTLADNLYWESLYTRAVEYVEAGHLQRAIELLTERLGVDPEHPESHAVLAIALVGTKRMFAAKHEAKLALQYAPESPIAHQAMASVLIANGDFAAAKQHLDQVLAQQPEHATAMLLHARIALLKDHTEEALDWVERSCAIDPNDAANWAVRAEVERLSGRIKLAAEYAQIALELNPENVEALVEMGRCELAVGNNQGAREHVLWALQISPEDPGAHRLLANIKAKESWLLGLWWRFNSWVTAGSTKRAILVLIGLFLVYRIGSVALGAHDMLAARKILDYTWIGFCVYSWFAIPLYRRSVQKELDSVRLKPGF